MSTQDDTPIYTDTVKAHDIDPATPEAPAPDPAPEQPTRKPQAPPNG